MRKKTQEETSESIRKRVIKAREIQKNRNGIGVYNGRIAAKEMEKICGMTNHAEKIMENYYNTKNLSMRGYHRTLRVARTIADLDGAQIIDEKHILFSLYPFLKIWSYKHRRIISGSFNAYSKMRLKIPV